MSKARHERNSAETLVRPDHVTTFPIQNRTYGSLLDQILSQDDYILKSYRGESEVEQLYFQNDAVFRRGCVRLLVDVVAVAAEVAEAFFDF